MRVPPSRMPSWHPPPSRPYAESPGLAPATLMDTTDMYASRTPGLLTSTTSGLAGHGVVGVVGACHGSVCLVRKDTKSLIKNMASCLGSSNWGEAKALTSAIYWARDQAMERMIKEAVAKGANAVIGLEVRETDVLGCVVVSVSATGVWVEKEKRGI
ncbi:hypothetical protein ACEQ8H_004682 [Pleosporales sp. CAS-2024a]